MKVNPEMVALAREYRKLKQGELAASLAFSQAKIARIENGDGPDLSAEDMANLSKALMFPADFFLQDEVRVGFGSSSYYYRKKAGLSAADRKRIQSLVNILRIHIKRMLGAVEVQNARQLRQLDLEEYAGVPGRVARALRDYWKLPNGPVKDITSVIEGAGVIVVPCDFQTKEMDGTSIWLGELPPLIFIRRDLPGDRWRFTLAHELGHLVMHDVPTESMEREADAFAAEFLMPEIEIRAQFSGMPKIGLPELANMKPYWKVAMTALLRRARDLGYLNDNAARYLYQRMSMMGIRLREPVEIERENPTTVQSLLKCFLNEMGYTVDSLAAFLRAPKSELLMLYDLSEKNTEASPPKLRLVR